MSLLDLVAPGIGPIIDIVGKVIDRVIPDPTAAQKAKDALTSTALQADISSMMAQIDVNKAEAQNSSIFVAGWRPAIGWICAGALGYQYLFSPILWWAATSFEWHVTAPPKLDDVLWQLLFGMLGMGALRSYDKVKGTDTKALKQARRK